MYSLTIEFGVIPKSERYERAFLVKDELEAYKIMYKDDFAFNPMNLRFGALARYNGLERIVISKYYNIFYCDEKVDTKFIELFLTSYKRIKYYNSMATGSLEEKKRVHYSDFKNFHFFFPSLPEQQKIATFLTTVDDKIQQLTRKKQLLEQYKKGCMQQIFSQVIRFKHDNGKDHPNWKINKMAEIGQFFSGGTPLTTKKEYYGGEIPFIKSGEINSEKTEQFITENGLKNSSAKMANIGDILYALYGATSGQVAISKIKGAINQAILCIRTNENHQFIYYFLDFKKEEIIQTYLQGGQGNLSAEIVKALQVPIPDQGEQQKIAKFLSAIDTKINLVNTQLQQTRQYKKGLLQQMFV